MPSSLRPARKVSSFTLPIFHLYSGHLMKERSKEACSFVPCRILQSDWCHLLIKIFFLLMHSFYIDALILACYRFYGNS